jgi:hypothetical protein
LIQAVVPAKAGTQYTRDYLLILGSGDYWMPDFAGMTVVAPQPSDSYPNISFIQSALCERQR